MKIAINTRLLLKDRLDGIGWFSYECLKRITQAHPEHEFFFLFDRMFHEDFIFGTNVTPILLPPPTRHPFLWQLWFEYQVPRVCKKLDIELFISTDGFLSTRLNIPQYTVIHDLNFVHNPFDLARSVRNYYNNWFPRFAHRAKRIGTVSEYSKHDICKTFGVPDDKIDVLYNGANDAYVPISSSEKEIIKRQYSDGCDYFIYIGSLNPRKNIARLLQAFDLFKKQINQPFKLVIVGETNFMTGDIRMTLKEMAHKDDVIFTGRLPVSRLKMVLAAAYGLTFVPYFEGFGLPILEALSCDVPVITSTTTSMPEVGGDAALYVEPFSIESIKDAMITLFNDDKLRDRLIEKGRLQRQLFSWQKTADKMWLSIETAIEQTQNSK